MEDSGRDCPFCNIDREKSRIVQAGDHVVVMLSNPRLAPGHLLVMPKRHIEVPWHLKRYEIAELYEYVLYYQQRIVERVAPGCDVRQNYRPFMPQGRLKINHMHFHLLPRWPYEQDELYQRSMRFESGIFAPLTDTERDKYLDMYTTHRLDPRFATA